MPSHRFARSLPVVSGLAGVLLAAGGVLAQPLSQNQVEDIVRRAINRANALRINATISVMDREGNILACVRMTDTTTDGLGAARSVPTTSVIRGGGAGGLDTSSLAVTYPTGEDLFVTTPNGGGARVATSLTATTKAGTAAYLSTAGNAFSTRTAAFIVQPNFPPRVTLQPSGPLFGVQFSSLPTSDFNRLPLGLSADSGGLPLYDASGQCRGGIGVECNDTRTADTGTYTVDTIKAFGTPSNEELIALAGQGSGPNGFAPPGFIRADNIFVGGIRLAYAYAAPPVATAFAAGTSNTFLTTESGAGRLAILFSPRAAQASMYTTVPLTDPAGGPEILYNGVRGQTVNGFDTGAVLNTVAGAANDPDGAGAVVSQQLTATDVQRALFNAHNINSRLRAMIRRDRPLISQVNVSVVDIDGNLLGYYRSPDAPVFGMDVSLQKARSALFFSLGATTTRASASAILANVSPPAPAVSVFAKYGTAMGLVGLNLDGSVAFGERTIGFLARTNLPDGIPFTARGASPRGPLGAFGPSPLAATNVFSPFNTGIQTDTLLQNTVRFLFTYGPGGGPDEGTNLTDFFTNRVGARPLTTSPLVAAIPGSGGLLVPSRVSFGPALNAGEADDVVGGNPLAPLSFPGRTLANGMQIFPGGVPLYKLDTTTNTGVLVGGIGISGDGIEQDDTVAFSGAGGFLPGSAGDFQRFGSNIARADRVFLTGTRFLRLPYVKFPRAGFSGL